MSEDYYQTLGINRDASKTDIERAYRSMARKYHPDMNPDDKTAKSKFQEVQRAFDVLSNQEKRELYDRYGSAFESMGSGGPGGPGGPSGGPGGSYTWTTTGGPDFEGVDFSQFFGEHSGGASPFADIFGAGGGTGSARSSRSSRRSRPVRGADIEHELKVPFALSVTGGEAALSVQRADGRLETITVKIPAGIEDGRKIRLRGQGETSPTGQGENGDILITIRVSPHPSYTRRGNNLECRVPVTVAEAALGAKIELPTPQGIITLTVPPGSSSGTRLRIKGYGVRPTNGPHGDLLAEVQIMLPDPIDADAQALIRQLGEKYTGDPRRHLKW
ncbi:MAG: J domain-containing protein [Planctomycetia bacterium]|nr:J domain-containing protein [Planctomycetia bacterium]